MLFAIILLAYLALAVGYSLASPIYEPTDELRHFRYVRHVIVNRTLPVLRPGAPRAQSHHPPLYYALGAMVSWWVPVAQDVYYDPPENPFWAYRYWEVSDDNKNLYLHGADERFPFYGVALAVYVVRWMTVLIGAGVVWLTYRIGREVSPDRPALALGGAAIVAFNPQFLNLSGAVNNDVAAALCGAAVLLVCVQMVRDGPRTLTDVTLGVLLGLALLTKLNLLALLGLIALAYLLAVTSAPALRWRALLRGAVVVLGLATLISGWWFWRNYALYRDPTGMKAVSELWAGRPPGDGWWAIPQSLPYLWSTLWGRFGYGQVPMPQPVYQGLLAFCLLALAGYLVSRHDSLPRRLLALLAITPVMFVLGVFYYILVQPAGAMGRFLFPALPAFATLLSWGLSRFAPRRLTWVTSLVVAIGMAALAVYALVGVLAPAFARPRPLSPSELEAIPNRIDVEFGEVARLMGYRVTPKGIEPGDTVNVTLYWKPLAQTDQNYAVFVHLLSDVGTMVAQRDTYPGLGRYPTTAWEPGVVFPDTYRVHVPKTAYAPDTACVQVGLYSPGGPRLATQNGRGASCQDRGTGALRLATVKIHPKPGKLPNPLHVNFGDKIALIGYGLDRRVARPGETVQLTLYWRTLAPMETDYKVFAHVLGAENQIWAGSDSHLKDGNAFTSQWQPGEEVREVRQLKVGMTTPPDFYDIELGLYAPGQGRLNVLADDGHDVGNRTFLSRVRVVPGE